MYCKRCGSEGHYADDCLTPALGIAAQRPVTTRKAVTRAVKKDRQAVTLRVTKAPNLDTVTSAVTPHCQTCRCWFKPKSPAERARAYRARKAEF